MQYYTDNAMKFTMDGGIAYEYKDDDDEPEDNVDYKQLAGITPPPPVAIVATHEACAL